METDSKAIGMNKKNPSPLHGFENDIKDVDLDNADPKANIKVEKMFS